MATTTPFYQWSVPTSSDLVKNGATAIETLGDSVDDSLWNSGFGQAGKNKIMNSDLTINQRSFTSTTATAYGFDRFNNVIGGGTGTATFSAQTFTAGTAPVAGYEGANYLRIVTTGQSATSTITRLQQSIENVRTFAGQTATFSFWAKAATGTPSISLELSQNYGTGGSPSTQINIVGGNVAITTLWARYSVTVAVPSLTGKTLGTTANTSALDFRLWFSAGSDFNARTGSLGIQSNTFEVWGFQAEYGSKATPFQTASGGSPQAELAMCQRYYYRFTGVTTGFLIASMGNDASSTTAGQALLKFPVTMRTIPSTLDTAGTWYYSNYAGSSVTLTSLTWNNSSSPDSGAIAVAAASGLLVTNKYQLLANNSTASYVGFSAEL
jgi:hypothetical protein